MLESLFSPPPLFPQWTEPASGDARYSHAYLQSRQRSHKTFFGGLVLSILLHALLLLVVRDMARPEGEQGAKGPRPLVVQLQPRPIPQIATPEVTTPAPPPRAPAKRHLMTIPRETASNTVPLEPPPVVERPREPPSPTDFSSLLEARRAQRRAAEEAIAQANAAARSQEQAGDGVADANINRNLQSLGGGGGTGGVFRILSMGHRHGQFAFNGWMPQRTNGWREVIDVDAGSDGDLEIAMIRRMIELIRKHYQGNFNWESHRLGRVITLSARKEDTAGLEAFMMREFFR